MLIDVTARDWSYAALLGEARRQSNNSNRKAHRHRGDEKNIHVDLMGSISELLGMKYFRGKIHPNERRQTLAGMFRPEGGKGKLGADFKFPSINRVLDVKTFDCDDRKRFFAINSSKHNDLKGQCDGYICVICPKYASKALIIDYVAYDDVSQWECKPLGGYGDPSFNLPISRFFSEYSPNLSLASLKKYETHTKTAISESLQCSVNRELFINHFPETAMYLPQLPAARDQAG